MIRLEHINIFVADMQETLDFYRTAFPHWRVRTQGEAEWYGTMRNWLHFGDEYNYLTFNDQGTGDNRDLKTTQLGLAHFAFEVTDIARIIQRLVAAGYAIHKEGAESPFRKNIYFLDPNGFEVEFVEYLSDNPEERNSDD